MEDTAVCMEEDMEVSALHFLFCYDVPIQNNLVLHLIYFLLFFINNI